MSIKYESAKVENYENAENPVNFDIDLGILVDVTANLFLGYSSFATLSTSPLMNLTSPVVGITIDTNGSVSKIFLPVVNRIEYPHIKYYSILSLALNEIEISQL